MPLLPLVDWLDGPDMIGTLIWKSIFRNCHLPRLSRLSGTAHPFLSEDSPQNKSSKSTSTHLKPFSIRVQRLFLLRLEKQRYWCVQQSARIWVAFPFHIWVTTTDTSAFVTVQYTTSSVELDKDRLFKTCHISTTQCTRTVLWCASRHQSSQENHLKDSGHDLMNNLNQSVNYGCIFRRFIVQGHKFQIMNDENMHQGYVAVQQRYLKLKIIIKV